MLDGTTAIHVSTLTFDVDPSMARSMKGRDKGQNAVVELLGGLCL